MKLYKSHSGNDATILFDSWFNLPLNIKSYLTISSFKCTNGCLLSRANRFRTTVSDLILPLGCSPYLFGGLTKSYNDSTKPSSIVLFRTLCHLALGCWKLYFGSDILSTIYGGHFPIFHVERKIYFFGMTSKTARSIKSRSCNASILEIRIYHSFQSLATLLIWRWCKRNRKTYLFQPSLYQVSIWELSWGPSQSCIV